MDDDKTKLLNSLRIDRSAQPAASTTNWPAILGVGVAAVAIAGALGWWLLQDQATPVHVAEARALSNASGSAAGAALVDATGYAVAQRQATVGPKIAGKLREVLIEEGMHVEAGQVIARLDDSNAMAALNQARASLQQSETAATDARPVFERARKQREQGLISQETFDSAKSAFDQADRGAQVARSALAVAQQNEDDTIVRAPYAGVVTVKAAQAGEIISPVSAGAGFTRTGVATVVDMDSIEVEVDVSENYINRIRAGQPCAITLNAYPDWRIPGHVVAVVPTADRTKATVRVKVGFDVKDARILPEMGARVSFLSEEKPDAAAAAARTKGVVVPAEAVATSGKQSFVFVVRDNRLERRAVSLGPKTANGQVVTSGLAGGEDVVSGDLGKLKDQQKVRPQQ